MTGRILYECLDLTIPSGGVRRLYRHVEILCRHGLPARMLHRRPGFRPAWFETDAPIDYWESGFTLNPDDILVIPEGHVDVIMSTATAQCQRIVIALNWAYIYRDLPIGRDWRDFNIRHVIAGSQYEREFVRRCMQLDSVVLASGTDGSVFRANGPKKLQIAYMPRKNAAGFHVIASIFRSQYPRWAHVPFVPIDSVSHTDVARTLSESAIFLATSYPEGLARPPLEAMASECIVVGFAGRGSLEYMMHGENCYRAEDADLLTAADHLNTALCQIACGGDEYMRAAARATAMRYSLQREEEAVLRFWRGFIGSSES